MRRGEGSGGRQLTDRFDAARLRGRRNGLTGHVDEQGVRQPGSSQIPSYSVDRRRATLHGFSVAMPSNRSTSRMSLEVSEHLVDSAAFKAVGCGDPTAAGSIPVHLRYQNLVGVAALRRASAGRGPEGLDDRRKDVFRLRRVAG